MIRTCEDCAASYDDARETTICPHEPFLTKFEAAQKDRAMAMIGKAIRFHDEARTDPDLHIQSIGFTGMITLREFDGEFAPHLFVVVAQIV